MTQPTSQEDVKVRIEGYISAVNKLRNNGSTVYVDYGRKYAKVHDGRSVHTFIDLTTGDVLKAASWAQPEKRNPRANVFAHDFGVSGVTEYGAVYLR